MFNPDKIKTDLPIFTQRPELVYLDSAATSQKPRAVIDAVTDFYSQQNANIHRGIYELAEEATAAYEGAREKVRQFINAKSNKEIVFVRNTTEAINLVARSWLEPKLKLSTENFQLITSLMEHHSNIVPWQLISSAYSLQLIAVNLTNDFQFDMDDYKKKLTDSKVALVAINHASNVLGTVNPVKEIARLAHEAGAKVLVDGAQAVPHLPVDVTDLDADFYAFSGHKMLGPTGIGVMYAKEQLLEEMEPFLGGGEMVRRVTLEKSEWKESPWKFEAGTPHIAGAVGLGAAIDYLNKLGRENMMEHEQLLGRYTFETLSQIPGLTIYGPAPRYQSSKPAQNQELPIAVIAAIGRHNFFDRLAIFSFAINGIHAHDLAQVLDDQSHIAIRAGHHCTMPLHEQVIRQPATARASLCIYNTKEDIDKLVAGLVKAVKILC